LVFPKKYFISKQLLSNSQGDLYKIICSDNGWVYFYSTTLLNINAKDTLTIYPQHFNADYEIPQEKRVIFNFQTTLNDAQFYQNTL
jgi:hypothetical protein